MATPRNKRLPKSPHHSEFTIWEPAAPQWVTKLAKRIAEGARESVTEAAWSAIMEWVGIGPNISTMAGQLADMQQLGIICEDLRVFAEHMPSIAEACAAHIDTAKLRKDMTAVTSSYLETVRLTSAYLKAKIKKTGRPDTRVRRLRLERSLRAAAECGGLAPKAARIWAEQLADHAVRNKTSVQALLKPRKVRPK